MDRFLITFFLFSLLACERCPEGSQNPDDDLRIWYSGEAVQFLDALPLGNGRQGAMVYGGVDQGRIDLNMSTCWSGESSPRHDNPKARMYLDSVRSLFFEGEYAPATEMCRDYLNGFRDNYGTHLFMGKLVVDFQYRSGELKNYTRELVLNTALSRVQYEMGGVEYIQESLASNPDQCIVIRLEAGKDGELAFDLNTAWEDRDVRITVVDPHTLAIKGKCREIIHSDGQCGVDYECMVRITECDGMISAEEGKIKVREAAGATVQVVSYSNFLHKNPGLRCREQMARLEDRDYFSIKKKHIEDHRSLFSRVSLKLAGEDFSTIPTDERLEALSNGVDDPGLYSLFYQYARYLLISSSREDSPLPANLQGIWNDDLASRMQWTCDFHLDINTQQNYWIAESGNLTECNEPLFRLIEGLVETGRRTARVMYDEPGWVAHVITNAWGFTAPGWGLGWGLHVTGGTWIASHLWHHYEYTGDISFLEERAYPVLKEAAQFFMSYMVEDPQSGWLVTGPSLSPENKYFGPDGGRYSEGMGPTCDAVLIQDLFNQCIEASVVLGKDKAFRAALQEMKLKLPPLRIGKHGQIMEWRKDYEEAIPNHRHTSHLIALFPSEQITLSSTPELAEAARVSIERRLSQPDWEDVEWSQGNNINYYARLGDGEKALKHLKELLTVDTDRNLMTFSRAGIAGAMENIWVMDGNTSGASGISEMLVQSYQDTIRILPALPLSWKEGSVRGIRTRGAFEVDLSWKEGSLHGLEIQSLKGNTLNVKYGNQRMSLETEPGQSYDLCKELKTR